MILYKPDCVSNYCELHAKHGKLHAHDHMITVRVSFDCE